MLRSIPSDFAEDDIKLIDGANMVHFLRPDKGIQTFNDYAQTKILLYIVNQLSTVKRVDIIWDQYLRVSLKATTRERRGAGVRHRLPSNGNVKIPNNWNSYLCNTSNKVELFEYISGEIAQFVFEEEKISITTCGENVLQNPAPQDDRSVIQSLSPCNHEEFDTRVMLHAANAVSQGCKRILMIDNDTDIIVLAVHLFAEIGADKLWVTFGMGKKFRYIFVHDIYNSISPNKASAFPAFHALTGSDNTYISKGKRSAYGKWSTNPNLTTALCHLMDRPSSLSSEDINSIESFVITLYSTSCPLSDINLARQQIFAQSSRTFEQTGVAKSKRMGLDRV